MEYNLNYLFKYIVIVKRYILLFYIYSLKFKSRLNFLIGQG